MADSAYLEQLTKPALFESDTITFSRQLKELLPITKQRLAGLKAFNQIEIPDRVRHLWRYSDPDAFLPKLPVAEWHVTEGSPKPTDTEQNTVVVDSTGLRSVNLGAELKEAGVQVESISTSPVAGRYLGRAVSANMGLFEALNTARWNTSVAVVVPPRACVETALTIVIDSDTPVALPRVLVIAGEQSQIRVVQEHRGGGKEHLTNCVTELVVEPGASLDHLLIQLYQPGSAVHFSSRGLISRDARFKQAVLSLGGKTIKADLGGVLRGKGANSEIIGVAFEDKKQRFDHHTVHQHTSEHTWSNIDFKAALTGRAKSAYTGLIRIEEQADFSEAYQESRNLLLSDRCHADSIPELEIMTNEVRCTHGATSAPIDQNEVFYLQSRGLTKNDAAKMIVKGFFGELLDKIPSSLRADVHELVEQRLESIDVE